MEQLSTILYVTVQLCLRHNKNPFYVQFSDHRIFQSKMSEVSTILLMPHLYSIGLIFIEPVNALPATW